MERYASTLAVTALYAATMLAGYQHRSASYTADAPSPATPAKVAASAEGTLASAAWTRVPSLISAAVVTPAAAAPVDPAVATDRSVLFRAEPLSALAAGAVPITPPQASTLRAGPAARTRTERVSLIGNTD